MSTADNENTRMRLIEAAADTFSEKGFKKASVREICGKASANIAAVNYYFRDKWGLYEEALAFAFEQEKKHFPTTLADEKTGSPEARLEQFIRLQMLPMTTPEKLTRFDRLMHWELLQPTGALENLVEKSIRPLHSQLTGLVRELLGIKGDETGRDVVLCVISIVGQCVHHRTAMHAIRILNPDMTYTPEDVEQITRQITAFSLGGLAAIRKARQDRFER